MPTHTQTNRVPKLRAAMRPVAPAGALMLLVVIAASRSGGLDALYAAGLTKGSAIPGLSDFFAKIKDNLFWLFGMVFVLGGIMAGIALSAAHSRGHDMLLRIGLGAAVVVAIPGVLL